MNENGKTKVQTFIGFSIRANKYKSGFNSIKTLKRCNLLLLCKSVSENSLKEAIKLKNQFKCKMYKSTEKLLSEYTFIENGKILAVTDKALSNAIIDNIQKDFIEII